MFNLEELCKQKPQEPLNTTQLFSRSTIRHSGAVDAKNNDDGHYITSDRRTKKRKRPPVDDDDDSNQESSRLSNKIPPNSSPAIKTLACPFYKRAPAEHQSCARVVLTKISYVKQHLIRRHSAPIYCPRCYETFGSNGELDDHYRKAIPCDIQHEKIVTGLSAAQREHLSRRSDQSLTDEGKWFEVWRTIFPNEPHPTSIFVDLDLPEEVNWLRDYMVTEIPGRLQPIIPEQPEEVTERISDMLLGMITDWKSLWQKGKMDNKDAGSTLCH
ncbi:hypothetical protein F5B20DRAFT_177009 [Whalleya microplaca]|nr:hypothetical protein F5B20DRAFT_177009 [Whalleya microplaca]